MSERLPYEEQLSQQWNDLPLPDENMAWADMKRRLEEDDDKPFLPFWLRGCAGWGLLGILFLAIGWWIVRPEKWFKARQGHEQVNTVNERKVNSSIDTVFNRTDSLTTTADNGDVDNVEKSKPVMDKTKTTDPAEKIATDNVKYPRDSGKLIRPAVTVINKKEGGTGQKHKTENDNSKIKNKPLVHIKEEGSDKEKQQKDPVAIRIQPKEVRIDSLTAIKKPVASTDTTQKQKTDSVKQIIKQEEPVKKPKTDSTKKKRLEFSAGIGLQQQLPVAGQKSVPYNSQGRKGTLADYIPSVYIRMTRPEKWFLQSEFRYGAPQYVKEFVYRQKLVNDTGSNPVFTRITSSTLKKTYYHQLPLVFNYFVRHNWSLGAGIQWNKFVSAVSEKTMIIRNNFLQQDSLVSKFIQKEKRDTASEFKKSYWQAVVETQYKWKRFSFGARYSFGLEPYIQFTLPGGGPQEEKNSSLQIFIRYELWKSKNK
jgi:hypothetical protein